MAGFMEQIGGLLQQYAGGGGAQTREEAHDHYDQIANAVPASVLGQSIGPALNEMPAEQVRSNIESSAAHMDTEQRGQFVQRLLQGLGGGAGGGLAAVLSRLGLNPNIASNPQQASPADAATLATHAKQERPEIFNQAMAFYAQHPQLVKVMGTVAIASIAKHLFRGGPWGR